MIPVQFDSHNDGWAMHNWNGTSSATLYAEGHGNEEHAVERQGASVSSISDIFGAPKGFISCFLETNT